MNQLDWNYPSQTGFIISYYANGIFKSNQSSCHIQYIRVESLEIDYTGSRERLVVFVPFSSLAEFLCCLSFSLHCILYATVLQLCCFLCFIMINYVIESKVSELKLVYIMLK